MKYKGFELHMTCGACPEQYDLFLNNQNVAYFRLRHGYFYVSCPFGGEVVYESYPKGDGLFEYDERDFELRSGINAVINHMLKNNEICLAGCHECKEQRYVFIDDFFVTCDSCSPYHSRFHYAIKN